MSIATRHGQISEETKSKIEQKLAKVHRFFDRLTAVELTADLKDAHRPGVHLNVSAEHKHDFVAQTESENLLSAVDAAVQKIEQQLRKYKEKVVQKSRNPDSRQAGSEMSADSPAESDE
ncbi:MAG: ribosome-associated translation inhibitor RaiA [Planctomycetota bacterium]